MSIEKEISGALKYVVEMHGIVQSKHAHGIIAPGARVKENPEVEAEVVRSGAIKCTRCRNYHTIQHNPMDCCDRCVFIVNEMLPDLVASGTWTQESADEWRELVRQSVNHWKAAT